jgi:hypothetical protein
MAFQGDRLVVVGYQEPAPGGSYLMDLRVDVYDGSGRLLRRTTRDRAGDDDELYAVSISPDGRYAGFTGYATTRPGAPTGAAGLSTGLGCEAPVGVVDLRTGRLAWLSYGDGLGFGSEAYAVSWARGSLLVAEDAWAAPAHVREGLGAAAVVEFTSVARLRALSGRSGAPVWTSAPSTGTRVGVTYGVATREDGKVAYLLGVEGVLYGVAYASVPPAYFWQRPPSDTFVRAVDTTTGAELWTGRDAGPVSAPGSVSTASVLLPVGHDVFVVGRRFLAATGVAYRGAWTLGRVLRFRGD